MKGRFGAHSGDPVTDFLGNEPRPVVGARRDF